MPLSDLGLTTRVAEAKARRDEAAAQFERLRERVQEPRPLPPPLPRLDPPVQSTQRQSPPIIHLDNPPPLPVTMPAASPVADLKNRTAVSMDYTPEASRILFETPTRVRYGAFATHTRDADPFAPLGSQGIAGQYHSPLQWPDRPFQIYITGQDEANPIGETLAHEFAHKWFDTQMPKELQYEFNLNNATLATPYAQQRIANYGNHNPLFMPGTETYAFNAQRDMYDMDDETRNRYYAGLFEGDQSKWENPTWLPLPAVLPRSIGEDWGPPNWNVPPTADVLRERAPWYSDDGLLG